jgi:hypothetical protein
VTSDNKETVNAELEVTKEQEQINAFIQQSETELLSYVNNLPTPMQEHMDELKKSGTIEEYQKFRALNINSSSDGIYYKMVEANQEDKIDKITTFSNYKNLKDTNFSANNDITKHRDYNPLARFGDKYGQLLLARDDTETNKEDVIHHKLPAQYATTDSDAATYNESKILLLSLSNETTGLNDV